VSNLKKINNKIFSIKDLKTKLSIWRENGEKIIFTNGCFDIIHKGHIQVLANTADLGDRLIIGLNSDISVQKLKGLNRPIVEEDARAFLLASINFVDAVVLFSEETPINLITTLKPNVLAKGGDYAISSVVGYKEVKEYNGEVIIMPFVDGFSSTSIIEKIKNNG
tara:strand:- start:995 stop:1489 length:495 start_codon:yes stop_codon:yes gene_type:complete